MRFTDTTHGLKRGGKLSGKKKTRGGAYRPYVIMEVSEKEVAKKSQVKKQFTEGTEEKSDLGGIGRNGKYWKKGGVGWAVPLRGSRKPVGTNKKTRQSFLAF